jgi:hypothetical protein
MGALAFYGPRDRHILELLFILFVDCVQVTAR